MSDVKPYELSSASDYTVFQFFSEGRNGKVDKRIQFGPFLLEDYGRVYNCAFGDWDEDRQTLDDRTITNNGDRDRVLSTVVDSIYIYADHYPERIIHIKGSDEVRTYLYGRIISMFRDDMFKEFRIFGVRYDKHRVATFHNFDRNERHLYERFLIERR